MELDYTEAQRDRAERRLARRANKVELMERHNAGMVAILYRLMKECVCTIYVEDERTNSSAEFVVPDKGVMEAWLHAFSHPDANLPPYGRRADD